MERTYTRPHRLSHLHDELLAAGVAPERVAGWGDEIRLTLPAGVDVARVDAVVAAHDPAAWDAGDAAAHQAVQTDADERGQLLTMLTADAALLADLAQVLTPDHQRAILLRLARAHLVVLRTLARREVAGVPDRATSA